MFLNAVSFKKNAGACAATNHGTYRCQACLLDEAAVRLARRSLGRTHPNPLVGAIILSRRGEKVGEGFHEKAGQPHAEVLALGRAGEKAGGGTLYCTLEPCNHVGRVGPCTQAILRAGIKHVVIASQDVNPLVSGQGVEC